jgi:hypothetical protein
MRANSTMMAKLMCKIFTLHIWPRKMSGLYPLQMTMKAAGKKSQAFEAE